MSDFDGFDLTRLGVMTTRRYLTRHGEPIQSEAESIATKTGLTIDQVQSVLNAMEDN